MQQSRSSPATHQSHRKRPTALHIFETMSPTRLLTAVALLAAAAAAPATYDQRQEGDFNVRADVQNIVLLAVVPSKIDSAVLESLGTLALLKSDKSGKGSADRRADQGSDDGSETDLLEAFVEPGTPYRVEISGKSALSDVQAEESPAPLVIIPVENDRYVTEERDGKVVEISSKRREDNAVVGEKEKSEALETPEEPLKLLGALEQCGPGRLRDQEGVCQEESAPASAQLEQN